MDFEDQKVLNGFVDISKKVRYQIPEEINMPMHGGVGVKGLYQRANKVSAFLIKYSPPFTPLPGGHSVIDFKLVINKLKVRIK